MSFETAPDQSEIEKSPNSSPFPKSGWVRLLYGLFITILPVFSFWAIQFLKPEWQSGELTAYLALLLQPEASILFLILLTYSIVCYILLLINPNRYSQLVAIRFGIYSGALLALQYTIILLLYLIDNRYSFTIILLWLFLIYFSKIYEGAVRKWDVRRVRSGLGILFMIVIVIAVINRQEFFPLFLAIVAVVIAAPFWSFLMAGQAAIWLFKNYETKLTLPRGLGITAWLVTYTAAWRYDILKMYMEYAKLPIAPPPDCYIATAAMRGHPQFVDSETIQRADGKSMQVNKQLQRLKCAELALMAVAPRFHQFSRKVYDVIGKRLAHRIQNPFIADVAYLLLKPGEWMARSLLRVVVHEIDSLSRKMYTK